MDSLKALAGSIKYVEQHFARINRIIIFSSRDACAVPNEEYNTEIICGGTGDFNGRKSSLLSSVSDYARSVNHDQHHRANSPNSDKTVSFLDEHIKIKSK
jgi:hypothetical protein